MLNLNSLSAYGTHPKEFDPEQVRPDLINLTTIIKWYLKYQDTEAISKPDEQVKDVTVNLQNNPIIWFLCVNAGLVCYCSS